MTKQKGFSAVILLLSVLVVTAVGFTGYYVWDSQQDKKTTEETKTVQANNPTNKSSTAENQKPAEVKYLNINEYQVKIPLKQDVIDLTYIYNPSEGTATITSEKYTNYQKDLSGMQNVSDLGGLGLLSRNDTKYNLKPGDAIPNEGPFIGYYIGNVNGKSYIFLPPSQSSCPQSNNTNLYNSCTAYENTQNSILTQVLTGIEAL